MKLIESNPLYIGAVCIFLVVVINFVGPNLALRPNKVDTSQKFQIAWWLYNLKLNLSKTYNITYLFFPVFIVGSQFFGFW